jgi:hypothetical protein
MLVPRSSGVQAAFFAEYREIGGPFRLFLAVGEPGFGVGHADDRATCPRFLETPAVPGESSALIGVTHVAGELLEVGFVHEHSLTLQI